MGFNDNPVHAFLSEENLDKYNAVFDKAAKAVEGDALSLYRVEKARLAIRYVRMKRRAQLDKVCDAEEINAFFNDWIGYGMTRIDEWVRWETTHKALLRGLWRGTEFYDHWAGEGGDEY